VAVSADATPSPLRRLPCTGLWAPAAATAAFAVLCTGAAVRSSAAFDEPFHLAAGAAILSAGDYRVDAEQPPLPRVWAALPVLLAGARAQAHSPAFERGDTWTFGPEFFASLPDPERMLALARLANLLWVFLLMLVLWDWARKLYGSDAGMLVLALAVLEPNLLAHAGVVGNDFPVAVLLAATLRAAWMAGRRLTAGAVAQICLGFACALLAKNSALVAAPFVALWLGLRALRRESWDVAAGGRVHCLRTRGRRLAAAAAVVAAMGLCAWGGVWLAYGLRWAPTPSGAHLVLRAAAREVAAAPPLLRVLDRAEAAHLLPNAWVQGMIHSWHRTQVRRTYVLGEVGHAPRWYYFPLAFLAKTPLTLLALFALGLGVWLHGARALPAGAWLVPAWLAVFWAVAVRTPLQIGLRHVLPVYPAVLLVAGAAFAWGLRRLPRAAAAVPVLLLALETAAVHPNLLAYFNVAAGGPDRADRLLVDSNLDWGQGLVQLREWMGANGVGRVNLSYFGSVDPAVYGIDAVVLEGSPPAAGKPGPPELPGYVAVGVTNLRGLYLPDARRGLYSALLETEPVATPARAIRVYRVDSPRSSAVPPGRASGAARPPRP